MSIKLVDNIKEHPNKLGSLKDYLMELANSGSKSIDTEICNAITVFWGKTGNPGFVIGGRGNGDVMSIMGALEVTKTALFATFAQPDSGSDDVS